MKPSLALLALLTLPLISSEALARGYYTPQNGTRAAGRAGAFTARADDLSAAAYNPAGFSRLGAMMQLDNKFSYNTHEFERANALDYSRTDQLGTPTSISFKNAENSEKLQLLDPLLGVSSNFGLEDFGFAFVAFAPSGVAAQQFPLTDFVAATAGTQTAYDDGQRYMMVKSKGMFLNYTFNAAWQYKDIFGIGAGFHWLAVPELEYQLVVVGAASSGNVGPGANPRDMLSTFKGSSLFTPNAMLGAWVRLSPAFELAVSGQVIPADVVLDGNLSVQSLNVGLSETDSSGRAGAGLLSPNDEVQLTLPLPMTARLGLRYIHLEDAKELFDVELNVAYETWSRVDKFRLDGRGKTATVLNDTLDIGVIDVPKNWQDTLTVQLGGDFTLSSLLSVRGGVFYESAVADAAYMNVDFVSGAQLGGALGLSLKLGSLELAVAQEYRVQPAVDVPSGEGRVYQQAPGGSCVAPYTDEALCNPNLLGQPGPTVNEGYYQASSLVTSLGVMYRF